MSESRNKKKQTSGTVKKTGTRGRPRKKQPEPQPNENEARCPNCNKLLFKAIGDCFIRIRCPRCGFQTNVRLNESETPKTSPEE